MARDDPKGDSLEAPLTVRAGEPFRLVLEVEADGFENGSASLSGALSFLDFARGGRDHVLPGLRPRGADGDHPDELGQTEASLWMIRGGPDAVRYPTRIPG